MGYQKFTAEILLSQNQQISVPGKDLCHALTNRGLQSFSYSIIAQNLSAATALVRVTFTLVVNNDALNLTREVDTRFQAYQQENTGSK